MAKMTEEDVSTELKALVDKFDKEDRSVRERQILVWRELQLMYEGFRKYYYDAVAHDWRLYDNASISDDTQQDAYDKPINVLRAYLETIFAALSVNTPVVEGYPDDATSELDLITAKAATRAAILLDKHNDGPLEWLHGLFIWGTEGMVASHIKEVNDKKYGTYKTEEYEDETETHQLTKCSQCGYVLDDINLPPGLVEQLTKLKDSAETSVENEQATEMCPNCNKEMIPQISQEPLIISKLVGVTSNPKSRISYPSYGGTNVKVANYARRQSDTPYLIFYEEKNYVDTFDLFDPDEYTHDELVNKLKDARGPRDYHDWARLSPQYNGEYPKDVVTVKRAWLRPNTFNALSEEKCKELKKKFPNGALVTLVNDLFASADDCDLDADWELTYNPLANHIHSNPLGLLLVSTQELTNDLISLVVQTIEHGISQTFADPGVLNFNAYRQMETVPGAIYEATPKSGKSVSDGFFSEKTAVLSGEVLPFLQQLQSLGQLASGALPSIFGGQIEGSDTASEYSMSRAQALQRLQNTWKVLSTWKKNTMGKAIVKFFNCIKKQGDENLVQKTGENNFFNVVIRRSELEGKLGSIELQGSDQLPITQGQIRDALMKLIELNNPEILEIIGSPENLSFVREAIGIDQFKVPGEDDRNKQYDEIRQLMASEPTPSPDPTGLQPAVPSVMVDPDFDNHQIEFEVLRNWVVSDVGRQAKIDNPIGFQNVLLHGKQHLMYIQQSAAMQAATANQGDKPEGSTEISNESDVKAIQ